MPVLQPVAFYVGADSRPCFRLGQSFQQPACPALERPAGQELVRFVLPAR